MWQVKRLSVGERERESFCDGIWTAFLSPIVEEVIVDIPGYSVFILKDAILAPISLKAHPTEYVPI